MKFSLKGIISISGKPGLYKVIAQGNQSVIVESLIDKKRMPAHSSNKISSLDEITMYTTDEDMPLAEIVQKIYEKENGGAAVDPKDEAKHRGYFKEIVPNYDEERVYGSDIKKLFSWYALLLSSGELKRIAEEAQKAAEEEGKEEKAEKTEKKAAKSAEAKGEDKTAEKKTKTAAKKKAEAGEEKEEKKEKKAADKKEKAPAKKTAAKTTAKAKPGTDSKKVKADSKGKVATVRKTGGQRGS